MNIIDAKGKTSFKAVTELHNAISTLEAGDFGILSDDKLVLRNIEKILTKKHIDFITEKKETGDFFTTFVTTSEHNIQLNPGIKEDLIKEDTIEIKPSNEYKKSDIVQKKYLMINTSLSTGPNLTLSKLHIRSILNEIAISGELFSAIVFSKEAVKVLDENHEFFSILKRVKHHGIKLIADEPSIAFYAVTPSKELSVISKSTGIIFKMFCEDNIKIITL